MKTEEHLEPTAAFIQRVTAAVSELKDYLQQDNKAGWNLGWVSAIDFEGRTIWIVDAHRDGKRFVVRADEKARSIC